MKKNYIAPSTVMATFASMGLMEGIGFATNTVSGGTSTTPATLDDANLID